MLAREQWVARLFLGSRCLGEKLCLNEAQARIEADRMIRRQPAQAECHTFVAPTGRCAE